MSFEGIEKIFKKTLVVGQKFDMLSVPLAHYVRRADRKAG